MLPKSDTIRCCNRHTDYPVPVLSTVKFDHHEWWCPHCGAKYQLFDGFKYYPIAYKLNLRREFFERLSLDYLSDKTENYIYHQRPDSFCDRWSDVDIAFALFGLGYRPKPEDIVAGSVFYTIERHKIDVVEVDGQLFLQNHLGKQIAMNTIKPDYIKSICILPSVQTTVDILTRAMS